MNGVEFAVTEGNDKVTLARVINETFCRTLEGECPLLNKVCYGVKPHHGKNIAYAVFSHEINKPTFEEYAACKERDHELTVENPRL